MMFIIIFALLKKFLNLDSKMWECWGSFHTTFSSVVIFHSTQVQSPLYSICCFYTELHWSQRMCLVPCSRYSFHFCPYFKNWPFDDQEKCEKEAPEFSLKQIYTFLLVSNKNFYLKKWSYNTWWYLLMWRIQMPLVSFSTVSHCRAESGFYN